jgi:VanZ family protein
MTIKHFRGLLIAYIILIISVSSIPGNSIPRFIFLSWDKLLHLVEYSILGYLAVNSLRAITKDQIIVIIISCLGFACFDELWQSLIPGRFSSGLDIIADGIGITMGSIFGSRLIINK